MFNPMVCRLQVYCTCHSAAHGEMVACDNDDCTIEWFHVGCVGYQKTGKDKRWCCAACKASGYVFKWGYNKVIH